jgi:hypothetical protein
MRARRGADDTATNPPSLRNMARTVSSPNHCCTAAKNRRMTETDATLAAAHGLIHDGQPLRDRAERRRVVRRMVFGVPLLKRT